MKAEYNRGGGLPINITSCSPGLPVTDKLAECCCWVIARG